MKLIKSNVRKNIKLKYVWFYGKVIYRDLSLFNIISTPIVAFDTISAHHVDYIYGNK
jgi:hypothetical protein